MKEFEAKYSVSISCHNSIRSVDHFPEVIKEYVTKSPLENLKLHRTKCTKLSTNVVAKAYYELRPKRAKRST